MDFSDFKAEVDVNFAEAYKMLTETGITDLAARTDLYGAKYQKMVHRCHVTQNGLIETRVVYQSFNGHFWVLARKYPI